MLKTIALSLVLLTSTSAFAFRNPQMRACLLAQGSFMIINTPNDQIGLCKIGLSYVGAIDLLNKDAQIEVPFSLYNYKRGLQVCADRNLLTLTMFDGQKLDVCYYSDGSLIDLETLNSGKNDPRNQLLNTAVGL